MMALSSPQLRYERHGVFLLPSLVRQLSEHLPALYFETKYDGLTAFPRIVPLLLGLFFLPFSKALQDFPT